MKIRFFTPMLLLLIKFPKTIVCEELPRLKNDLSNHKVANQSKTYPGPYEQYKADNAVDGDVTTCMRTDPIGFNNPDKTVWWMVDLGGVYNIYSVNILLKNYEGHEERQQGRFAGFSLFISNNGLMDNSSLCYKDGPMLPPLNFTTVCITSGRYVIFYNERLDGVTYPSGYELVNVFMELCEVSVDGCLTPGAYGSNCSQQCPTNCRDNTCHILNGTCFGCEPGWIGTTCSANCTDEWYGMNCTQRCSGNCKDNVPCNHSTGFCDAGCAAGWKGYFCNASCEDGTYGENCVNNCSGNCLNDSSCNKQTGHCDRGCKPGYMNGLCNKSCTYGFYGDGCRYKCSEHCFSKSNCNHTNGACIGGCQDGYIETLCDDSCQEGYYGNNCSGVCSPNCKTCRHTDGKCSCRAGWTGFNCSTGCVQSYGEDCRFPCSEHCVNKTCDIFNGTCLSACYIGFHGERCDQACEDGTYGENCVNNCSGNCLNDSSCNKQTGHCEGGCKPGYINGTCKEPCVQSFYGADCLNECSEHCSNKSNCVHINGECIGGCEDGYIGTRCDASCQEGHFGSNCSGICSSNCKTCRHTDGECSCRAGWMGPNCSTGCKQSYGENCLYPCGQFCINQTCDTVTGYCSCDVEEVSRGVKCYKDIFIDPRPEESFSLWNYGGPISVGVNFIFIIGMLICLWGIRTKRVFVNFKQETFVKSDLYEEAEPTPEDASQYQELGVYEGVNPYGNTTCVYEGVNPYGNTTLT